MIGWILYIGVTLPAGILLSFLIRLARNDVGQNAENPFGALKVCVVFAIGAPFAYSEIVTSRMGDQLSPAVEQCYKDASFNGPMKYFRVKSISLDKATAIVVGEEPDKWGGTDRPIVEVHLSKTGSGKWKADSYDVLHSERLGKDTLVFPPYH